MYFTALKVVTLSLKDVELQSRQITWKLRQRAMSNGIVMHELNETPRKRTSGEKWLTAVKPQAIHEGEKYSVSGKIYATEITL